MSELYELPEGWEWKKLGDISKLIGGGTPKRNMNEYWDNGDIVWLSPTDLGKIGDIIYISDSKDKITQLGLDKSSAKLLPIGTVLYSSRATIGKIAINTVELSTNQGFTNFICSNELDNLYLAYCLNNFTSDITSLSNSTTFKEVSKSNLKEFKIPLPPLKEQKRIVAKLDTLFQMIDKSIALHQKNMDEADVFMGSVLNDVFEELEEKYGLIKINDTVLKTNNINPKNNMDKPFTYIDISSIDNKSFKIIEPKQLIGKEAPSRAKKEVLLGDIIYATTRPNLKNIAIIRDVYENPIASTGFCVLRVNKDFINSYLFHYMTTDKLFEQIEPNIRGAQYPATSDKDLKNCNIPNTPLQIQQKTVEYLDKVSEKIEKIKSVQKEKMDSLVALKASILDQAFRGQL